MILFVLETNNFEFWHSSISQQSSAFSFMQNIQSFVQLGSSDEDLNGHNIIITSKLYYEDRLPVGQSAPLINWPIATTSL